MKSEIKATLKLAIPIMIGQVGQILMGLTDSIFLGRLGPAPLAASSFVNSVWAIPYVSFVGLSTAITVFVSQKKGANEFSECGEYFSKGLIVTFLASMVLMAIMLSLGPYLSVFKQPGDVLEQAQKFYYVIILTFFPLAFFQGFKQFTDGLGYTVVATVSTLIGVVVNAFLNYLLVFGKMGFPRLEIFGSALATLISRSAMAIIIMFYVFKSEKFKVYLQGFKLNWDFKKIDEILRVGLPTGFAFLFEVGAFAGAGILMGWVGTYELAAHQIALNLASLSFMVALGYGLAASIRVGEASGSMNWQKVSLIGKSSILFILILESIFALSFILGRFLFPTFYIDDPKVLEISARLLIFAGIFQIFDGMQALCMGLLRGMSDVFIPSVFAFTAYWLIGLPMSYSLAFLFKVNENGIWIGLTLALFFSATFLVIRFLIIARRKLLLF